MKKIWLLLIIIFMQCTNLSINAQKDDNITIKGKSSSTNFEDKSEDINNVLCLQLHNNIGFVLPYKNEAVRFLADNKEVVFILKDIKDGKAYIEFPERKIVEEIEIDKPKIISLQGYPNIIIELRGCTENRAKIKIAVDIAADANADDKSETQKLKIVLEMEFVGKSFIEIYLDGVRKKRGFVDNGSRERWEASESIQVRLGNAGGVKVKINGKDYNFGEKGQVAQKVITWEKNKNLFNIVIKDW